MATSFVWRDESPETAPTPGSVVLTCFPSAGLAAIVAAHYMVRALNLPRVGVLDSDDALPLAVIQRGEVQPAIRVYGKAGLNIMMSEFPPSFSSVRPIADGILDGAERLRARLLIAVEGVVPHPTDSEEEDPAALAKMPEEMVWAITARRDAALSAQFERAQARPLSEAVIGGVSGALLVRAQRRSLPVAALLVSARAIEGYPDHRAGAALIEAIDRLLPDLMIDTGPLRSQAVTIERALRAAIQSRAARDVPGGGTTPPSPETQAIYR
jgi:predicted ATP-grasp superfamily ATP-dependent carboligase